MLVFETVAAIRLKSEYEKFQQGINTDTTVYDIFYSYYEPRMILKGDTIKWDGKVFIARSFSKVETINKKHFYINSIAMQGG